MGRFVVTALLGLAGCGGGTEPTDTDADAPADTDTDTDTDDTGSGADTGDTGPVGVQVLAADCALGATGLVVECSATLSAAAPATLVLATDGQPDRTFTSDADDTEHGLVGWGLKPDRDYTWSIGEASGTVRTEPLPVTLRGHRLSASGTPFGFDAVLRPIDCDNQVWFVIVDGEGDIVWHHPSDQFSSQLDGYDWSAADRTLLTVSRATFLEHDVTGAEVLRLERGVHFEGDLHHDVTRWGPYTYLLFERQDGVLDVDGIHVFDDTTLLGTFYLGQHYDTSTGGGFFGDWAHSNGVKADETGEIVMSLLNFDTVLGIVGDPADPAFLEIAWSAVGTTDGLPDPVYVAPVGIDEGFAGQHNASLHDRTEVWLFDNGSQATSRAAHYTLDPVGGAISLVEAWDLGRWCPVQGGSVPIDGGVLATCPEGASIRAFRTGSTEPDWELTGECDADIFPVGINRGIPITIE